MVGAGLESSVRMGVLDPIRRLCESHQLQFFVVLQSSSAPKRRFWSSSEQMNNLCGNLIYEFATYVATVEPNPKDVGEEILELKCENAKDISFVEPKNEAVDVDDDGNAITIDDDDDDIDNDECVLLPEEESEEIGADANKGESRIVDNDDDNDDIVDRLSSSKTFGKRKSQLPTSSLRRRVPPPPPPPPSSALLPPPPSSALLSPPAFSPLGVTLPLPSSPQRSDEDIDRFLDDDDADDDDDGDDDNNDDTKGDESSNSNPLPDSTSPVVTNPTVWKSYEFSRPMRRSTMKRLFKDKLVFNRAHHLTTDAEYSPVLIKILKKANPYCVLYPKRLCRYIRAKDEYLAEFICRYDSCLLQVDAIIDCRTNQVSAKLFHRRTNYNIPRPPRTNAVDQGPFITFAAHEPDEDGQFPSVVAEKQITVKSALTADEIKRVFLADLKDKYSKWGSFQHKVVTTKDYVRALAPAIKTVNPFCSFTDPIQDCFVRRNKHEKGFFDPRLISARLACGHAGCGLRVHIVVANPSGDVELCFMRRSQVEMAHLMKEGADFVTPSSSSSSGEAVESDLLMLDHSGKLRVNPEVEMEKAPPDYVLRLPSKIEHDEPLSQDVIKKYVMVPIPPARHSKLGPGESRIPNTRKSEYMIFVRPIIAKYNPNCFIVTRFTKILQRPYGMTMYLKCKRKDCDFACKGFIDGLTGRISLELKNSDAGVEAKLPFCYIRHPPDKRIYVLRQCELETYVEAAMNLTTREIMDRFGLSKSQADKLKTRCQEKLIADREKLIDKDASKDATPSTY